MITDYLYISSWPEGKHLEDIRARNIQLILSMHWRRPAVELRESSVKVLWLPTFDTPLIPMPIHTLVEGVEAALPVIQDGYGVLTHCRHGIHRSAAMASCVLIGKGYTADQAMALIKEKRSVANPYIGYIRARIRKFESYWNQISSH